MRIACPTWYLSRFIPLAFTLTFTKLNAVPIPQSLNSTCSCDPDCFWFGQDLGWKCCDFVCKGDNPRMCDEKCGQIHAKYLPWNKWSVCDYHYADPKLRNLLPRGVEDQTIEYRVRICDNPKAHLGAKNCSRLGEAVQTKPCKNIADHRVAAIVFLCLFLFLIAVAVICLLLYGRYYRPDRRTTVKPETQGPQPRVFKETMNPLFKKRNLFYRFVRNDDANNYYCRFVKNKNNDRIGRPNSSTVDSIVGPPNSKGAFIDSPPNSEDVRSDFGTTQSVRSDATSTRGDAVEESTSRVDSQLFVSGSSRMGTFDTIDELQ